MKKLLQTLLVLGAVLALAPATSSLAAGTMTSETDPNRFNGNSQSCNQKPKYACTSRGWFL